MEFILEFGMQENFLMKAKVLLFSLKNKGLCFESCRLCMSLKIKIQSQVWMRAEKGQCL